MVARGLAVALLACSLASALGGRHVLSQSVGVGEREQFSPAALATGALLWASPGALAAERSLGPARAIGGHRPPRAGLLGILRGLNLKPGASLVQPNLQWNLIAKEEMAHGDRRPPKDGGSVWQASLVSEDGSQKDVVVKVEPLLVRRPDGSIVTRKDVMREAALMERFSGGSFVDFLGWWEKAGSMMLIMGNSRGNLDQLVLHKRFDEVSLTTRVKLISQLIAGLFTLGRAGFVHRDISPSSLMIESEGGALRLRIGGLSHARKMPTDPSKALVGDPRYRAPEAWRMKWTTKSDIFSAGLVIYQLLFEGDLPGSGLPEDFSTENLEAFDASKDERIRRAKAMAKDEGEDGLVRLLTVLERMLALEEHQRIDTVDATRELISINVSGIICVPILRVASRHAKEGAARVSSPSPPGAGAKVRLAST